MPMLSKQGRVVELLRLVVAKRSESSESSATAVGGISAHVHPVCLGSP
jgi:hypothetical protein